MSINNTLKRERNKLLHRVEQLLEGPMIFLGFLWLILLIIELIRGLNPALQFLSTAIWILFIIDFIIKFFIAPKKLFFLKRNWLTLLSLIIPALRVIRIVRFVRILRAVRGIRLVRVVSSINRSMKSLNATMKRRGVVYVIAMTIAVSLAGAAGMYAFENDQPGGLQSFGTSLWWTMMLIISIGSDYWPQTIEGRVLCFLLSLYGFGVLGYITATLASFFIGRDAEEKDAPLAGSAEIELLKAEIMELTKAVKALTEMPVRVKGER